MVKTDLEIFMKIKNELDEAIYKKEDEQLAELLGLNSNGKKL